MTEQEKIQQADSVHLTGDDGQVPSAASRGEAAGDRTAAPTQPEPPLGNFMGFMYLARRPCGRVSAMRWDDQGHERNTAASVAEWIADGLTVDRVKRHEGDPLPEWICDGCRGNPCKEQPSQSQGHGAPTGQSRTFEAGEATCASNEPDEQDSSSVSAPVAAQPAASGVLPVEAQSLALDVLRQAMADAGTSGPMYHELIRCFCEEWTKAAAPAAQPADSAMEVLRSKSSAVQHAHKECGVAFVTYEGSTFHLNEFAQYVTRLEDAIRARALVAKETPHAR